VRCRSEVLAGSGDGHLEQLTLVDRMSQATTEVPASWVFIFIGASPRTEWLGADVVRDKAGFVLTGHDLLNPGTEPVWPLDRPPYALETSVPGVFASPGSPPHRLFTDEGVVRPTP
jgi:thioredoxin reductase (NADPH)